MRFLWRYLLPGLLLCAFCNSPAPAQKAGIRLSTITSSAGLINDYVKCLCQDHLGYLWIGTYDGLCRYDGSSFKSFRRVFGDTASLPSNTIFDIAEDKWGTIWISTGKGICSYDPRRQQISRHLLTPAEPSAYSYSLTTSGDTLLFTTEQAFYQYRTGSDGGQRLIARLPFPKAKNGARERICASGHVLHGSRMYAVQQGALKDVSPNDESDKPFPIMDVAGSKTGLLITDAAQARIVVESGSIMTSSYPPKGMLAAGDVFTFIRMPGKDFFDDEVALIGTGKSGLITFNIRTHQFAAFTHNPADVFSLSNNEVTDVLSSPNGLLWIGTGYGLNLYDNLSQDQQTLFIRQGAGLLQDRITDVLPADSTLNGLWLGTFKSGLVYYDRAKSTSRIYPLPSHAGSIHCLSATSDGTLWIGCEGGMYYLRKAAAGVQDIKIPDGASPRFISSITPLTGGKLLVTSFEEGCIIYDTRSATALQVGSSNGLFNNRCTDAVPAGSRGFAVTHIGTGFSFFNPATSTASAVNLQPLLEKELTYPATFTYTAYADGDSVLWLGTGLGLVRYDIRKQHAYLVPITTRLKTDNEIWSIVPGTYPILWLKTTFGVYGYNRYTGAIENFYPLEREHIPSQEGYFRMRSARGELLVPGYGAVHLINTSALKMQPIDMRVIISDLKVAGKPVSFNPDATEISVVLEPGQSTLDVSFSAVQYRHAPYITYIYLLEGGENKFYELGTKNFLSFPNLDAGSYRLLISARDYQAHNVAIPFIISIRVKPYLWQRPLFYILLVMLVGGAIYAFYRYRLAQVIALQQVRQKISKDLHDDIGATVSSIGILAAMAKTGEMAAEKKEQFLQTISENTRYVTEALSDIVWSINPRNDSLSSIFARLQRYAAELFEAKDIQYTISLPDHKVDERALSMNARQHLLLIFKEAVNNLAKYSAATEARISFSVTAGKLFMEVHDNGKGFDPEEAHGGNGIYNMRKRAEEAGAKLRIQSIKGTGTDIVLEVPL